MCSLVHRVVALTIFIHKFLLLYAEIYVPLRSVISRQVVNGWKHDDLEMQFKIQVTFMSLLKLGFVPVSYKFYVKFSPHGKLTTSLFLLLCSFNYRL